MMTSAAKKLDRVRDRAKFTPIPPNLDINELVKSCRNFHHVSRADARTFNSAERLKEMIQSQVIDGGKPLVLENWHETPDWPKWIFKPEWLVDNHGQDPINIRDISSMKDHSFSMKHYLNSLSILASKFTAQDYDSTKQRLYAKDIDCPPAWQKSLEKILPACTFYLSPADLMSHLPIDARAENLMCYFGHEGTYTPAHKEMCASLGQNIMVYTSPGGSSLWFMTASEDRDVVAEYWLGGLGHDIEVESHFASIEALKNAPFPVYIVEQKVGDFILVPPLAPHQVWNRGEATMKVAWNRTTAETLKLAIEESLPKARLVCRDEQYKNKAIIYETLKHYHQILSREVSRDHDISLSKLKADFCMLFELFDTIMLDEHFSPVYEERMEVKRIPNEFNVTCSFCRGNIFNRFLSCKRCVEPSDDEGGDDDVYDICMECYARGRSCACISKLCWEEQYDWNTLLRDHEKFRMQVISIEGAVTEDSPKKLATAFKNIEKKSLAWVCQEQLLARPFVDVTKDASLDDVDDAKDIERKKRMGLLVNCHVCKVRHPDWKIAKCNACSKAYCYGNLWRAFDIDPFEVLCDAEWKCPFCLGICSCGQCRKNGKMIPYEPKGTMLGASTKHVADPRSVESLVDFSRGNLTWLSENIESLKRKRSPIGADDDDAIARSFTSFDEYGAIDEEEEGYGLHHNGEIPIDPSLVVSSDDAPKAGDDDYHEPDLDGSVRNGQYIANYPSVSVERGSYHQADGKASAVASATKSIRAPGAMERRGNPLDKQPLLPSPKDMLTGALPLRREALPHDTILSHPSSYYSSEVRNMFDKPQSKDLKDDAQLYTHQSLSRIDADNQSMWPEMSSLERNPEAFIAAAGLSILSGIESYPGELSSSSEAIGSHLLGTSSSWPAASTITGLPEDLACYAEGILHSPQTTRGRDRDEAENTANPFPDDTYNPIAPIMLAKAKRKSNPYGISAATSEIIGVNGTFPMTEPTQSMYELMADDQAKKQKRARYITSKGKGRNKKALVVKLKLGVEGWQKWEEKTIEPDMITEYYMKGGRLHKVTAKRDDINSADSSKRQRGRPRKSALTVSETDSDQEKDEEEDEDEGEDEDEEEMEVIPAPKSRRRESAWIARKREEEAAEAAEKAIKDAKFAQEKAIEDAQQRILDERQRIVNEERAAEEEKMRKERARLQAIEDEKEERRRAYREAKVLAAEVAEGMLEGTQEVDSDEEDNLHMSENEDIPQERSTFWESQLPSSSFAVVIEKRPGIYWRSQYATETELSTRAGLTPRNATKTAQPVPVPATDVPTSIPPTPQSKINTATNPALKRWRVEKSVPVNRTTPKSSAPTSIVRKPNLSPKVNTAAIAPIPKSKDDETAGSNKWQPSIQKTSTELAKSIPTTGFLKDKLSIIKDESSGSEWGDDEAWGDRDDSANVAKKWMY